MLLSDSLEQSDAVRYEEADDWDPLEFRLSCLLNEKVISCHGQGLSAFSFAGRFGTEALPGLTLLKIFTGRLWYKGFLRLKHAVSAVESHAKEADTRRDDEDVYIKYDLKKVLKNV